MLGGAGLYGTEGAAKIDVKPLPVFWGNVLKLVLSAAIPALFTRRVTIKFFSISTSR